LSARGRLLLLSTSMGLGGAERQVVDLAGGLHARGWDVLVVSMTRPTAFEEELDAAGIELRHLGMARGRPTPGAFLRYVSTVRDWKPDVVHSHMVHANLMARLGHLLRPRVPVVCTIHNVVEGPRWREVAYRLTDRLASATTAVSAAATERFVRVGAVPADRITTLRNGFDPERARVTDEARSRSRRELGVDEDFLWLSVGRLEPQKGYDILLQAFATLRQRRVDARLAIVGSGPEREPLREMAAVLGLDGSVALLGPRRDVPSLLAAADGFVLSSRWEGLPMVLLEAAAQALPIVATDVGGCREVARPDLGAVLTEPAAEPIADAMLRVMELGRAERAVVGEALRQHVLDEFGLDAVLARWEELYREVTKTA
jgi:glycosyltransferase involved in cell wall biosynthesis